MNNKITLNNKSETMKGKFKGINNPMYGKNPFKNKTEDEINEIKKKLENLIQGESNQKKLKIKLENLKQVESFRQKQKKK